MRHYYYDCSGSELTLSSCSMYYYYYYCYSSDNAGVRCVPNFGMFIVNIIIIYLNNKGTCSPNGALRLTGGNNTDEGVLEYCYNGHWSPFCSLDVEEAIVACKQLGYEPYASKIVCTYKG